MKRIYLDNAATSPVSKEVLKEMEKYSDSKYGNPGSIHKEGRDARLAIEDARKRVSKVLHVLNNEIIFNSGATEGNNLAIRGVVNQFMIDNPKIVPHIITTQFEHGATLETVKSLEALGQVEVTYLKPSEDGFISPKDVRDALRDNTALVSIIYANNEIGTIQPIKEISLVLKKHKHLEGLNYKPYPVFHIDAAQAPGYISIRMDKLGCDMASFSSQKFNGPKGFGIFYKKRSVKIIPEITGGDHELGLRAGTENLPSTMGTVLALEIADKKQEVTNKELTKLQDDFIKKVSTEIPEAILNGSKENRLPGNVNFSFPEVEAEQMVIELDDKGVACSVGAACAISRTEGSHVIMSITNDQSRIKSAVRFSFGTDIKTKDLDYTIEIIKKVINKQKIIK